MEGGGNRRFPVFLILVGVLIGFMGLIFAIDGAASLSLAGFDRLRAQELMARLGLVGGILGMVVAFLSWKLDIWKTVPAMPPVPPLLRRAMTVLLIITFVLLIPFFFLPQTGFIEILIGACLLLMGILLVARAGGLLKHGLPLVLLLIGLAACESKPKYKSALPFDQARLDLSLGAMWAGEQGIRKSQLTRIFDQELKAVGVKLVPASENVIKAVYSETEGSGIMGAPLMSNCPLTGLHTSMLLEVRQGDKVVMERTLETEPMSYSFNTQLEGGENLCDKIRAQIIVQGRQMFDSIFYGEDSPFRAPPDQPAAS